MTRGLAEEMMARGAVKEDTEAREAAVEEAAMGAQKVVEEWKAVMMAR